MKFLQRLVERRIQALPMTLYLKDSFSWVGAVFGGAYGFSQSLQKGNGVVWRPTVGAVCGGTLGFSIGLFPYQAFGVVLAIDTLYTFSPWQHPMKKKIYH